MRKFQSWFASCSLLTHSLSRRLPILVVALFEIILNHDVEMRRGTDLIGCRRLRGADALVVVPRAFSSIFDMPLHTT
jgi:hypothetical protein